MQNDEYNPADTIRMSGSESQESSKSVLLSPNTKDRLERLAQWRIDPGSIEFRRGAPKFTGGYAVVSRALLCSSPDNTRDQLVASEDGNLKTNNGIESLGDHGRRREAGESNEGAKHKDGEGPEGQEHDCDGEISGRWKAVAVKKMKIETQDDVVRVLGLTLREMEFLVSLCHENIIKLEGFVEDLSKEMIWLVFPWEANGTLKEFIASKEWEIPERISLIHDVTKGLEYLHSRKPPICHGDLKSVNILVNLDCAALITDFGSARRPLTKCPNRESQRTTIEPQDVLSPEATFCPSTNTITLTCNNYTLRWAAPELLQDDDVSLASDIWALGWVAYEVMTNSIPFQDVKDALVIKRVVCGDLPCISNCVRMALIQKLCSLVGRCWSINPSMRPAAEDCRIAVEWMPMVIPKPGRTEDTAFIDSRYAELLMKLGYMYKRHSDHPQASEYYIKALGVYTNITDSEGRAVALYRLAEIRTLQAKHSQAATLYSKSQAIWNDIRDRRRWTCFDYHGTFRFYSGCQQVKNHARDSRGTDDVLWSLAEAYVLRNDYDNAIVLYSECLGFRTEARDEQGRADALWALAEVHRARNDYDQAIPLYSMCLKIRTESGDEQGRADALRALAEVHRALWALAEGHRARKDYVKAIEFYSKFLEFSTKTGDERGRADALWALAEVHRARNDYDQAIPLYSMCLKIRTKSGDEQGRADALRALAEVHRALWALAEGHRARKDYVEAIALYSKCLEFRTETGDEQGRADALWALADVHRGRKDYAKAIALYFKYPNSGPKQVFRFLGEGGCEPERV